MISGREGGQPVHFLSFDRHFFKLAIHKHAPRNNWSYNHYNSTLKCASTVCQGQNVAGASRETWRNDARSVPKSTGQTDRHKTVIPSSSWVMCSPPASWACRCLFPPELN